MASLGNPKTLFPYLKNKDCSQGFCRLYCPQWCYIISPPPPPFEFPDDNSSGPKISPLVIAIIGILASAFLLVSYYTLISKYCGNNDPARRRDQSQGQNEEIEGDHHPSLHEPWHVATTGLDEVIIRSITVCRYKKGDGLIDGTDCSVCLSEFEEDESLRLLPKCSHAFHVPCIDTVEMCCLKVLTCCMKTISICMCFVFCWNKGLNKSLGDLLVMPKCKPNVAVVLLIFSYSCYFPSIN